MSKRYNLLHSGGAEGDEMIKTILGAILLGIYVNEQQRGNIVLAGGILTAGVIMIAMGAAE